MSASPQHMDEPGSVMEGTSEAGTSIDDGDPGVVADTASAPVVTGDVSSSGDAPSLTEETVSAGASLTIGEADSASTPQVPSADSPGLGNLGPLPEPSVQENLEPLPEPSVQENVEPLPEPSVQENVETLPEPSVQENLEPLPEPSVQENVEPLPEPSVQENLEPLPEPSVQENLEPLPEPSVQENVEPLPEPSVQENLEPLPKPSVQENLEPLPEPSVQENLKPLPEPSVQGNLVEEGAGEAREVEDTDCTEEVKQEQEEVAECSLGMRVISAVDECNMDTSASKSPDDDAAEAPMDADTQTDVDTQVDTVSSMHTEDQSEKMQVDSTEDHSSNMDTAARTLGKAEGSPQDAEEVGIAPEPMEEASSKGDRPTSAMTPPDSSTNQPDSTGTATPQELENGVRGLPAKSVSAPAHDYALKKEVPPVKSEAKPAKKADALLPSVSPPVKIKDEPVDEEYEQALVPPAPTTGVKDEPDTAEVSQPQPDPEDFGQQKPSDEFKISAVFSVGGSSTAMAASPAAAPSKTMTVTLPSVSIPQLAPASSLCVVCSGCKKVLLKGQTAYQRKGSSQLFCSTICLTGYTVPPVKLTGRKSCHYCLKDIDNPKDVIIAPVDSSGAVKDFCSQRCLSAFNFKRESANSALSERKSRCSMCQKVCTTQHEVNYMGVVHKMCSDECFTRFRSSNKLTMNCCVNCGGYCYNGSGQCHILQIEGASKKFCSQSCVTTYKKKSQKPIACTMCRVLRSTAEMVEGTNSDGKTELFCSPACVTAHKVQTVSSSGASVECNHCKGKAVPQYHLAMSDGSIRNFCSFNCVVSFQDVFNKTTSQGQMNVVPSVASSSPQPAAPTSSPAEPPSSVTPPVPSRASPILRLPTTKLPCKHCHRLLSAKPELVEFKGSMFHFCDKSCAEDFRKVSFVMARCEYCKIDKVVKEVKRINKVDCSFCSEGCKLLYKHDLAKRWGKKHCRNCAYCGSTSQILVTSVFSGKQEEFCGNECLSLYTLLFCQVAKCSACKHSGKMAESLKWLGEMKHFCNLACLLNFCSALSNADLQSGKTKQTVVVPKATATQVSIAPATPATASHGITHPRSKEATPVIANVISLSGAPNGQPSALANTALKGAVPAAQKKITGHASTQTDAVKPPPVPPPRILKNKALLCKPMSQNKGTMCKPNTTNTEAQTDAKYPTVIVLPIPVPVFLPVPMHLYTQHTPQALGLPIPVPVPMFLPTTLDSAERIVETIQKIKERIPTDPLEADLIMMAEMVAEDNERDMLASQVPEDQGSAYSGDCAEFDLDALSTHLDWEDESTSSTKRLAQAPEPEKAPSRRASETRTPSPPLPPEPQMDLEADFPIESFELLAQVKEQQSAPTPIRRPRRRARDGFPQKKRARKRAGTAAAAAPAAPQSALPDTSKLHHEYGVNAWKSWVRWRNTQPDVEKPRFGSRAIELKEDMLHCTTAELSYGLCKFISEVKRPNGETYCPDSLFYLCMGLQQHLFENGRMENIFTDLFYSKFTLEITRMLKDWKPTIMPSGYVHSRVEEEYLWECKQLGAYSPSVLLNTLLFFCTKLFNFKTVEQHQRLSFAHVMRCSKSQRNSKISCLRFYPPVPKKENATIAETEVVVPGKRKKEDEDEEPVLEMPENIENPLRCPVRLYEFYLSKCSASVKQRTNAFYLQPERSCVPNSPMWFSSASLPAEALDNMLTRILTVRDLHLEREPPEQPSPDSDEDYSE